MKRVLCGNNSLPSGSLLGTYESELMHILDVYYQFPPDPVHLPIARQRMLDPNLVIDCDPLEWDPEYLVLGETNNESGIYIPVIESGAFHLVQVYAGYEIYAPSR